MANPALAQEPGLGPYSLPGSGSALLAFNGRTEVSTDDTGRQDKDDRVVSGLVTGTNN